MAMAEEVIGSADYAEEWIEEDSQLASTSASASRFFFLFANAISC